MKKRDSGDAQSAEQWGLRMAVSRFGRVWDRDNGSFSSESRAPGPESRL